MTGTRLETFANGRRLEEREGSLLLNAWGPDGGLEILDGAGTRMEFDGELGTQHRVRYSGGKVVRQW